MEESKNSTGTRRRRVGGEEALRMRRRLDADVHSTEVVMMQYNGKAQMQMLLQHADVPMQ